MAISLEQNKICKHQIRLLLKARALIWYPILDTYFGIKFMRHNDKYGDLCTYYWPEKVTKVKFMMALHLKIYFMSCANHVQNFMLLSKSAQFLALLYYSGQPAI